MTFFEWFYKNLIVQGIFVLIILISLIAIKFLFKETYQKVQKFYLDYITTDTSISEVIDNAL